MLTRVYGITFPSKEQLQEYLFNLEEAKKRDHRKIEPGGQLNFPNRKAAERIRRQAFRRKQSEHHRCCRCPKVSPWIQKSGGS